MVCLPRCPPQAPPLGPGTRKIFRGILMQNWSMRMWFKSVQTRVLLLPTICRRARFKAKGGTETCAVIKAPALLDLSRAGGLRDVLLAGRAADTGARGQWWRLVPNGLGWSGIVHPDPIPEAHFTANSDDKQVKHLRAIHSFRKMKVAVFFLTDHNVHAIDLNETLSCVILGALGSSRGAAWAC